MRKVYVVIGNALKSASSIYSYLARIPIWQWCTPDHNGQAKTQVEALYGGPIS